MYQTYEVYKGKKSQGIDRGDEFRRDVGSVSATVEVVGGDGGVVGAASVTIIPSIVKIASCEGKEDK